METMKKIVGIFLTFMLLLSWIPIKTIPITVAFAAEFNGGSGTIDDPYQVSTPAQLNAVRKHLNAYFIQTCDIDMTSLTEEKEWIPIGTSGGTVSTYNYFSGFYDGGGFGVTGLKINSAKYIGLFARNSGTIKNLHLTDCSTGSLTLSSLSDSHLGWIAGENTGTIENCYITNSAITTTTAYNYTADGTHYIGTITGYNTGIIRNCYTTGSITATSAYSSRSKILICAGGITGYNSGTTMACYNVGDISTSTAMRTFTGGLIGNNQGTIESCYNTGAISGSAHAYSFVGGITGSGVLSTSIKNCYNTGSISASVSTYGGGSAHAGGITSSDNGKPKITDCYWNLDSEQIVNGENLINADKTGGFDAISKTTDEMQDATFVDLLNIGSSDNVTWYKDIQNINKGYPIFRYESSHNWGTWTITKQPTQTETGTAERICQNDNSHKEQKELPVLTDTSVWTQGEYKAPTCEADGYQKYTSEYGEVTETISALGHSFTHYISDGNATCEADGTETAKCDRCDATDTRTAVGSATGHNWGAWEITKQPTQTEAGTAERICQNDNSHKDQKELPVLTDTTVWAQGERVEPTCTADGSQVYTSEYGTVTETLQKLGHSFTNYVSDGNATCETDGTETAKCDRCDATDTRTAVGSATGHDWSTWTITKQPTQTGTGTAERVCQNDNSHKDTATLPVLTDTNVWTQGERVEPTCTADGSQVYTSEYGTVTETLQKLGHSFTNYVSDGNATCETDGTETAKCDRCDATDTRTAVGSATGHDWSTWTITKQPTQTGTGTAERVCQNDNSHKDTVTLSVLTDTATWTKGEYQAPTCEADGYQKYTSEYGEVTETIPATGHSWGAWTITKQPTQTETGTAERVCQNDSSHKETKDLPVLTDTSVWTKGERVEPTCTVNGSQIYTSEYGTVTEVIPALGHSFTNYVSDGNATCEADGTETAKCDRCDATDTRTAVGSATGHSWGAWAITKQPTQTETGTAERVCQNDNSHKETKDIPVLTDTSVWTKGEYKAPTCDTDGYQKYTSEYGEVTETIPATGHSWGAWTITKQPTQTETGTAERICQNDGSHKETKDIPVLTDTSVWTKGEYKAPTCDTDGYQKYTSEYGEVTETIPAKGHSWGAWAITKQPTQTETGTAERVCQNDGSHKDTKELPVLTDTTVWTTGERVEPTCTADGSQVYTSEYGTVTEILPATGHIFEWVIDRPATVEEPGIKHEECTKCHEKRNENTEIPQLPVESYVIHYDANGGSGTMPDGAAPKDKEFTLPENAFTPPAGKQFKCWAIGSIDGTQIQPGAGFTFTENTTVYAVWIFIGDVNGDDMINFQDAQLILQYEVGLVALSSEQLKAADVNGDGVVNFQDAQLILQYESGIIDSLKVR